MSENYILILTTYWRNRLRYLVYVFTTVFIFSAGCGKRVEDKHYEDSLRALDVILLIDSSGSMGPYWVGAKTGSPRGTDPESFRVEAAKLFTVLLSEESQLSVIEFSEDAIIRRSLACLTDINERKHTLTEIEKIGHEGKFTDIRKGILAARKEIQLNGVKGNKKIVVLLTDGKIQTDPTDEQFAKEYYQYTEEEKQIYKKKARAIPEAYQIAKQKYGKTKEKIHKQLMEKLKEYVNNTSTDWIEDEIKIFKDGGWEIHTVGLSQMADEQLLRRIADGTSRNAAENHFYFTPTAKELNRIFHQIIFGENPPQITKTEHFKLGPGEKGQGKVPIDPFIDKTAIFEFIFDEKYSPEDLNISVTDPDGVIVDTNYTNAVAFRSDSFAVFRMENIKEGTWVNNVANTGQKYVNIAFDYSGYSNLALCLSGLKLTYVFDDNMELLVSLDYTGKVPRDITINSCNARILSLLEQDKEIGFLEFKPEGGNFIGNYKVTQAGRFKLALTAALSYKGAQTTRVKNKFFEVKNKIDVYAGTPRGILDFGRFRRGRLSPVQEIVVESSYDSADLSFSYDGSWINVPCDVEIYPSLVPNSANISTKGKAPIPVKLSTSIEPVKKYIRGRYNGNLIVQAKTADGPYEFKIPIRFRIINLWDIIFPYIAVLSTIGLIILSFFVAAYIVLWKMTPWAGMFYRSSVGVSFQVFDEEHRIESGAFRRKLRFIDKVSILRKNVIRIGSGRHCNIKLDNLPDLAAKIVFKRRYVRLIIKGDGRKSRLLKPSQDEFNIGKYRVLIIFGS